MSTNVDLISHPNYVRVQDEHFDVSPNISGRT